MIFTVLDYIFKFECEIMIDRVKYAKAHAPVFSLMTSVHV